MTDTQPTTEPSIQQLFDLKGKTSLITGASGYLGRSMAFALAEAGSKVIVTSRNKKRAQSVAGDLPDPNDNGHHGIVLDQMASETTIETAFQDIVDHIGHIDILINNGHEFERNDWTDVSAEQFTRQMGNATGYFILARLLREHVLKRKAPANIIMLGSMYGQVGSYPDTYAGICPASAVAYHTLKGGIIHLTRHLAVYWAKDNIRVNCLSPGPFPSESVGNRLISKLKTKSPMGRMGKPSELKGAIVFLASDASSYMTGQNLTIDGGWTAW